MADITKELVIIVKALGVRFTLNGAAMTVEEVLAPTSMLPAIAKRADQLASLCLGYGIGVSFEEDKETKLGSKAKFDDITPNILRYLCILDVVSELMRNKDMSGNTPLDDLLYE
jgi:intracellular multiplication protein IcmS